MKKDKKTGKVEIYHKTLDSLHPIAYATFEAQKDGYLKLDVLDNGCLTVSEIIESKKRQLALFHPDCWVYWSAVDDD